MAALFILKEGSSTEWQVWPERDEIPPGEIAEGGVYLIELRDTDDSIGVELAIDDLPLEALRTRDARLARWRWNPGFHAGMVEIVLSSAGTASRRFEVRVDPERYKLTREEFQKMLRDILEDSFALFALGPFREGIARSPGSKPPPVARLEFLRSRIEAIEEVLTQIERAPRHRMAATEIVTPYHRAMRATGPELVRSLRCGRLVSQEPGKTSRLPRQLRGYLPKEVRLRTRVNSVDIAEHRQIKSVLRSWAVWLASVAQLLELKADPKDVKKISTEWRWSRKARRLSGRVRAMVDARWLAEVGEGPATLVMSQLFRGDLRYRRFYRLWQDMNVGLASVFGDFLNMPLSHTFKLYEFWCFLRLLRACVEEYGVSGLDVKSLFEKSRRGEVIITAGAVTVPLGEGRHLCFQRQYREYWSDDSGQGTFSRAMIPDVVLVQSAEDGASSIIVLDAKYRINEGLNSALDSIHSYRDALVQQVDGGQVVGLVKAAYLLTPHVAEIAADYRNAPVPGRLFHPMYRKDFKFGAVTLRPGMSDLDVRACLRDIVEDATSPVHG